MPIKELVYQSRVDVLQIWLVDGPLDETFNKALDDDGLYKVVRLARPSETVGWEIVGFQHYANVHSRWRTLASHLKNLPGGTVTWHEPSPAAGIQQLIPA